MILRVIYLGSLLTALIGAAGGCGSSARPAPDGSSARDVVAHDPEAERGSAFDRFRIISWDADATFGISWDGTPVAPTEENWHGHDAFSPRLYGIPHYREALGSWLVEALDGGRFDVDALVARVDRWREQLRPYAQDDYARWGRDLDFDAEMDRLVDAIRARHETMTRVAAPLRP